MPLSNCCNQVIVCVGVYAHACVLVCICIWISMCALVFCIPCKEKMCCVLKKLISYNFIIFLTLYVILILFDVIYNYYSLVKPDNVKNVLITYSFFCQSVQSNYCSLSIAKQTACCIIYWDMNKQTKYASRTNDFLNYFYSQ